MEQEKKKTESETEKDSISGFQAEQEDKEAEVAALEPEEAADGNREKSEAV